MATRLKVLLTVRPVWLLIAAVVIALTVGVLIPTGPGFRGPLVDINDGSLLAILAFMGVFLGQMWLRLTALETKYADLWKDLEAAALVKRKAGDHIDVLEHHIWEGKPPPPPPRPDGV